MKWKTMSVRLTNSWILAALLFLVVGCDRGAKPPQTKSVVGSKDGLTADAPLTSEQASDFSVTLLPEAPRSNDELSAVIRGGSGPFSLVWKINGEPLAGQNQTRLRMLGLVRGDVIQVLVTSTAGEASAEVVILNNPPKVVSVVNKTPYLYSGVDLQVEPRAKDADGDAVEFRFLWRVNGKELFYETDRTLPGDSYHKGDRIKLEVTPTDGQEEGEAYSKGLEFEVGNAPPRIVSSPPTSITSLDYRYEVRATDADEDEITYRLASGPEGMTIDPASGLVLWSIPADESGTFEVRIEALDAEGEGAWQEYALEINRTPALAEGEAKSN